MDVVKNIPSAEGWNVIDSRPSEGLYLLSPEEDKMEELGFLIGMIVDLNNKVIVSGSSGFVQTSVTDKIERHTDGDVHLTDMFGRDHQLKEGEYYMRHYFEGIRVRVFYHNGNMYVSSDKKINVDKSKVCNSITFLEMYESMDGPSAETLFDTSKKYSPWVYHFTISTPETRWVNKIPFPVGLLIFDGPNAAYDSETSPYPNDEVDFNMWDFSNRVTTDLSQVTSGQPSDKYYMIPGLDLNGANTFLTDGFNPQVNSPETKPEDIRLGPGEAVLITVVPKGGIPYQIQVWSPGYEWRFGIVNENFHLPHQFYVLANAIHIDTNSTEGLQDFQSKMPLFPQYQVSQLVDHIKEQGPILSWPNELKPKVSDVYNQEGRLYNVWASLLMAVPFDSQRIVAPLFDEFFKVRKDVTEWLQMIEEQNEVIDVVEVGPRARDIIQDTRRLANEWTHANRSKEQQVQANIKYFIENEYTDSLYRLKRNMQNYYRMQESTKTE